MGGTYWLPSCSHPVCGPAAGLLYGRRSALGLSVGMFNQRNQPPILCVCSGSELAKDPVLGTFVSSTNTVYTSNGRARFYRVCDCVCCTGMITMLHWK